mmetsp:Transcript_3570/g.4857  ORF Transcript_3570/g.4857 Transcript_3570/m.4857 type:complete len:159 (-) Transcript_3570:142-618(-)|eukprot:CAMPEP_0116066956 /NCGR_PEP_ID=MMETSP0322-20121206/10712_1 /TAXON_ID=163516 /ORGANISM="Leptocylindrus danicus var. apora, Strain B651" /LENGTH=158 /DNA_ID=CAMNT_0003553651 /DNA_START=291 /DNA_END=767 /DNA_ORIENTATION=-
MSFVRYVSLRVPCAAARPGPAIGQALGPLGINMAEFCKQFNDKSENLPYAKETPLSVRLNAMSDRTFTFDIRSPPTSWMILQASGLKSKAQGGAGGAKQPSPNSIVGYITPEQVYEIAKIKHKDSMRDHLPLEGVARSVIGTAKSMGILVKEHEEESE